MKIKMNSKLAGCLALVVGIWMSLSVMAQAAMIPYTDIPSIYSPWLTDQIAYLYREGCVYVPRDKKFRGDEKLTRYDVAYLMGQVAHKLDGISSADVTFSDVPRSHWAYRRVAMAVKSGLMDGFEDGTFRGDQPITNYELAVALDRALAKKNLSDYTKLYDFVDMPKNHWAYKAACSMHNTDIMASKEVYSEEIPDPDGITVHVKWDGKTLEFHGDGTQTRYIAMQWFCRLIEALSK